MSDDAFGNDDGDLLQLLGVQVSTERENEQRARAPSRKIDRKPVGNTRNPKIRGSPLG